MPDHDYYAVLGVPESVSDADLKSAYRNLVRRAHPDNGGSADTFQRIQYAYRHIRATRAESTPPTHRTATATRRRPDRWTRMVCWSCGMRTAQRPMAVVLTKRDEPDERVDLPHCDWCWSQRVSARDRHLAAALRTAGATSKAGLALLVVAFTSLVTMVVYLRFFFTPADSVILVGLMWAAVVVLLAAGLWPVCGRAVRIRRAARDFHLRLVDDPQVNALLGLGYRL